MINRDLNKLQRWSEKWYMHFNPQKTTFMKFTMGRGPNYDINIKLNDTKLNPATTHKHLGLILTPNLNFSPHIDYLIKKSSKWIGIIWKLQRKYPRHILENIYTSYIRPAIEYGHIIYHNTTRQNSQRLEAVQRKAAVACTGAYTNTSHSRLLSELGWTPLEERRNHAKYIMTYKIVNNLAPPYLSSLLPSSRGNAQRYNLRNNWDLTLLPTRLESFRKSFIPSAITLWNSLAEDIRNCPSVASFKKRTKASVVKCKAYTMGTGTGSINLTRIRLNMSGLNYHLHTIGVKDTNFCMCDNSSIEDPTHFLWLCPLYDIYRQSLVLKLLDLNNQSMDAAMEDASLHELTNIVVNGHINNTATENRDIFICVEQYITETKRFT